MIAAYILIQTEVGMIGDVAAQITAIKGPFDLPCLAE
jgi:hypothetical protein